MLHETKLEPYVVAKTFPWLADNAFVTEVHYKGRQLVFWDAPAALDADGRVDQTALLDYHNVNCEIFMEQGGLKKYGETK